MKFLLSKWHQWRFDGLTREIYRLTFAIDRIGPGETSSYEDALRKHRAKLFFARQRHLDQLI